MNGRATVIGLGDFFAGDYGAGGYVLEALQQEPAHPKVTYAFLGLEAWKTGLCALGSDRIYIVHGVSSGHFPGSIRFLDLIGYQQFCELPFVSTLFGSAVLDSLAKIAFFGTGSDSLHFILPEIQNHSGLSLSKPARQSVRKVVQHISRSLIRAGWQTQVPTNVSRLYRLDLLSLAV